MIGAKYKGNLYIPRLHSSIQDFIFLYSSNKIRKTQNEHLIIICQVCSYLVAIFFSLYHLAFDLDIGIS